MRATPPWRCSYRSDSLTIVRSSKRNVKLPAKVEPVHLQNGGGDGATKHNMSMQSAYAEWYCSVLRWIYWPLCTNARRYRQVSSSLRRDAAEMKTLDGISHMSIELTDWCTALNLTHELPHHQRPDVCASNCGFVLAEVWTKDHLAIYWYFTTNKHTKSSPFSWRRAKDKTSSPVSVDVSFGL